MVNSEIQLQILANILKSDDGLKYSEAQVPDIESDLYNYHLQQLVKKGLVKKSFDRYVLTKEGAIEVSRIDAKGNLKTFLKVSVLFSALRTVDGKLELVSEIRKRQPLYGDRGIMAGTVQKGEFITDAAKRKLKEETGLIAHNFKFIGVVRKIRQDKTGNVWDDALYHVCFTDDFEGELITENEFGTHAWVDLDTLIAYESSSQAYDKHFLKIIEMLRTSNYKDIPMFYFEDKVEIDGGW